MNTQFKTFKYHLGEVADIERSKKDATYPIGTIHIRLSATDGKLRILREATKIGGGFAIITPRNFDPYYFFEALDMALPKFLHQYQTTINLQFELLEYLEIRLHPDLAARELIAAVAKKCDAAIAHEERMVEIYKNIKTVALDKMLV